MLSDLRLTTHLGNRAKKRPPGRDASCWELRRKKALNPEVEEQKRTAVGHASVHNILDMPNCSLVRSSLLILYFLANLLVDEQIIAMCW